MSQNKLNTMVSVEEALQLVLKEAHMLTPLQLPLKQAIGLTLSQAVLSPIDSPPFDQSAMDGYAIQLDSITNLEEIPLSTDIPAGSIEPKNLQNGTAAGIYTGAPLPKDADTVVVVEDTSRTEKGIRIHNTALIKGSHIRKRASQIAAGDTAVKPGTRLTAGVIGFLAGLGIQNVWVYPKPKIGIMVSGNELVEAGNALQVGQIYESNSITLAAALFAGGFEPVFIEKIKDDLNLIQTCIQEKIQQCDMLLMTGGVSVGKYDFVMQALENCGTQSIFHKVKQKPGKPLYFGKNGNKWVFGLPGNPSSVLTCFYEYVVPAIRKICQWGLPFSDAKYLVLKNDLNKNPNLTVFAKAHMQGEEVEILEGQESYKLNAFVDADAFAIFPEGKAYFKIGEKVLVHPIHTCWI